MSQSHPIGFYEVVDYTIAAVLFLQGAQLVAIRRDPSSARYPRGCTVFSFSDGETTRQIHQEYLCGKLRIDPLQLLSKIKEYRQLIYDSDALGHVSIPGGS